jgi:D-alanine--poly(phosphoribitol) ligase subunit 1
MEMLSRLRELAVTDGQRAAVTGESCTLSYSQLDKYSDRLAVWLNEPERSEAHSARPVAVYGHKNPFMLVCFIAAVKSGRAYCPLDVSMPESRVNDIISDLDPDIVFDLSDDGITCKKTGIEDIIRIVSDTSGRYENYDHSCAVKGSDTFYIIFTSGSTGRPKGVKISADCLNNYLDWSVTLGSTINEKAGKMFLNQAPFSFDLSVMDTYTCLASGGTLALMEKTAQNDYAKMVKFFRNTPINIWVSTPSFADICMAEPSFSSELLPSLEIFIFCGEEFTTGTYERLRKRFPESRIINTYGPTESTVAVTGVEITDSIYKSATEGNRKLPAGVPRKGTTVKIEDGEIIIVGDTVSTGYFNDPEKTAEVFFEVSEGQGIRGYRTGDLGCIENGQLYCMGRKDFQIKLHGYRIEPGDIEQNLTALPEIRQAVVLPVEKDGRVKSLTAYVVADTDDVRSIKEKLRERLPKYMIPKKIVLLESMPVNSNGKADRKQLRSMR